MTSIRLAKNTDTDQIISVKPQITTAEIEKRLELQQNQHAEFFVVEDELELLGFVLLKWNGKLTHPEYPDIEDLYIKESARGKGLATKLIQECEKRAQEKGFSKIGLAVNPSENCPAKKLYIKLGYMHDGSKEYVDGIYDGVEDIAIDLEKTLIT